MNSNTSESADATPASRQMVRHLYRQSMLSSLSQHPVPRKAKRIYARLMASLGYRQYRQLSMTEPWITTKVAKVQRMLAPWIRPSHPVMGT